MRRTTSRATLVAAAVAGLASLGAAFVAAPMPLGTGSAPLGVLTLAIGAMSAVLMLSAAPERRRPAGLVLMAAGALLAVAGLVLLSRTSYPSLPIAMLGWSLFLSTAASLVPAGWIAAGVAAALAGAGLLGRRRGVVIAAVLLAIGTAGCFAGSALALSVVRSASVLQFDRRGATIAVVLTLTAVPLAALLVRLVAPRLPGWPSLIRAAPEHAHGSHHRALVVTGASIGLGAIAAVAVAGWGAFAPRIVLGEVFPDPVLAACVAEAVDESGPDATVSSTRLEQVLSLACHGDPGPSIRSLTGVEELRNLASLDLSSNEISDLRPLAGLPKLGSLKLTHNLAADLTPLAGLPVLTDLGLSDNAITDLRPLAQVPTLRSLGLASNRVTDLAPLAGLTQLAFLDLSQNQFSDVTPLGGLAQLNRLTLTDNAVADPSALGLLPFLTMLDIARNQVADASTFTGFPSLTELWVGGNPITDLTPLVLLPELMGVDLEGIDSGTPGVADLEARNVYVGGRA